jgi:hypothetical protein
MGTADARMGQVVGFRRTGIPGGNSSHLANAAIFITWERTGGRGPLRAPRYKLANSVARLVHREVDGRWGSPNGPRGGVNRN